MKLTPGNWKDGGGLSPRLGSEYVSTRIRFEKSVVEGVQATVLLLEQTLMER